MVCRASRYSSAMVTFARDMTSLEDNQVLSINHQLMREAGSTATEQDRTTWQTAISEAMDDYRAGRLQISRSSHDPLARLQSALAESPDRDRIYAGRRLIARCQEADTAQQTYLQRYARDLGISESAARSRFNQEFAIASEHSGLQPSPRFVTRFLGNPDNAGISQDRRTMYALEMLETSRLAHVASTATPITNESYELDMPASETGPCDVRWNSQASHLEIDFVDPQDGYRTELYCPDSAYLGQMRSRLESGQINEIIDELRGNTAHHYSSHREAHRHRNQYRCGTCGQFANVTHNCPVIGSASSIEADIAALAGLPFAGSTPSEVPTITTSTRRYATEDGMVRIPGLSRLQVEARNRNAVEFSVNSVINDFTQQGTAELVYDGYGNGYTVNLATLEGDAGDRRLRCSCPEYEDRRTCHHVELLQSNLNDLANGVNRPSVDQVQTATADITSEIREQAAASVASARSEQEVWTAPVQPLSENPEVFQEIYKEVREKRAAWLQNPEGEAFPLDYQRENAFAGLSTRENGRGFGIEIEFAFPDDMSTTEAHEARSRIAQELADAGLTRDARIRGYGSSHGWVRDNHTRGWSFEEDFSAAGRDGQVPGEIVSPIMYDEPETWQNIEKICEIVRRNGGFASRGAGQHVHVSTGDYDHRVVNHNRLLSIVAENEDLLYRMSVEPRRGRHRGFGYCSPNPAASAPYSRISEVRRAHSGHNLGVNFQSVSGRDSDHAEFRMFDSSLEPAVIQAQIGMSLAMVAGAKRDAITNIPAEHHAPLGTKLTANPRREALTGDAWKEQTQPVRSFLDKYVPTLGAAPKDSALTRQLIGLFAMTKWQQRR